MVFCKLTSRWQQRPNWIDLRHSGVLKMSELFLNSLNRLKFVNFATFSLISYINWVFRRLLPYIFTSFDHFWILTFPWGFSWFSFNPFQTKSCVSLSMKHLKVTYHKAVQSLRGWSWQTMTNFSFWGFAQFLCLRRIARTLQQRAQSIQIK